MKKKFTIVTCCFHYNLFMIVCNKIDKMLHGEKYMEYRHLSNGNNIATIGFGTYLIQKSETIKAVYNAIKEGYRHIDTAAAYENEEQVGYAIAQCIAEGIVKREDLFITSKISPHKKIGYQEAIDAIETSLAKLGLDYIDLYLIHWPNVAPGAMWKKLNAETWRGFEECYNRGLVKNLGVSNFMIHHLEELFKTAKIKPVVNQLHISPIWQQKEVVNWCKEHDIQCVAWSPLVRYNDWAGNTLGNQDYSVCEDWTADTMNELSQRYNKSKAQISLRWSIQKGLIPLAKSTHVERMKENLDIFDFVISEDDMAKLDNLNARPCNPDATPDSIYNSWSMGIALGKQTYEVKSKFKICGLTFIKKKRINDKKTKYYLFGFLPILKRLKKSKNLYKYKTFFNIPIAKKEVKIKTVQNNDFLPNYNKKDEPKKIEVPKWDPFEDIIFNGYDNYSDYMPEAGNSFFKFYLKLRFLLTRKVYLPLLTFRITSDCSLKCKECCAFTPYYKLNYMATFDSFKQDLDKILESVDQIHYLNLFGGEPTLNPDLAKMIKYANTKKQIHKIFFTTNGTKIIPMDIINAIKEKKENFIYMSDYRTNASIEILKQDEIIKQLQEKQVPYFHIKHDFGTSQTIHPNKRISDLNLLRHQYFSCFEKNARIVEDGRYWSCTIARDLSATNQYDLDNSHYINLRTNKNLTKEFINFFKHDYFKICEVCDFSNAGYLRLPATQVTEENFEECKNKKIIFD